MIFKPDRPGRHSWGTISLQTLAAVVTLMLTCLTASALEPEEVLVVANRNASKSIGLARYYMERRAIPKKNLVLLFMTDAETCTREAYTEKAVPPVRRFLDKNPGIRAIVTVFGVPLRIASPGKTPEEDKERHELEMKQNALEDQLGKGILDPDLKHQKETELTRVKKSLSDFNKRTDKVAAFDSELALVQKEGYDLNMWLPNPYYLGFRNQTLDISQSEVLMVSRLDAADDTIVRRIIDDSIAAEKEGLSGRAYFDARWEDPGDKKTSGYAFYDQSLHRAARLLIKQERLPVVLDQSDALFQPGEAPQAALYCGWYSLAKYIDAFTWQKGSVGFHIASAECTTLKNPESQVWCKKMLDKGIAATVGPVGEPYVQAFPVPEIFFNFLTDGYLTLAESYLVSLPYLSWKMVLVGDPLYRVTLKP